MEAEIKNDHGTPTVFLNGSPVTGLMHWTRLPSEEDTVLFRDAGIHFYSFMGNLSIPAPAGTPPAELEIHDGGLERMLLTPENIDRLMKMLTSLDPEIKVLPRIIMNPPVWWEKKHPEELMVYHHFDSGKNIRGPRASMASVLWKNTWREALRNLIAYFEEKWSPYIFGYHTGLGDCGEHCYKWWDHAADFSPRNQPVFQNFLREKYRTISGLNQVWRTAYRSFEEIPLPDPERYNQRGPRTPALFLPGEELDLVDFQRFASDRMAETLLTEAGTVKEVLREKNRKKLFGAFYGYINLVANSSQTTVGHSALNRILDSPDVDFICGPLSYAARQNGGTVLPQMIVDSIRLHGKLFYNEDDTGTSVVPRPHHGYIPATITESVHAERRNFLSTWRSGGSQWWMDLYGCGWFLAGELKEEFARLKQFAETHFEDRRSLAQTAVFLSAENTHWFRDNPVPLTGSLVEHQLTELGTFGAPFDLFQAEDIPLLAKNGALAQYKFCIFPNLVEVSDSLLADINRYLKKDGRTLLWFYAPGAIRNHTWSEKNAEDLTGIQFASLSSGIMPMLTETWIRGLRISYGLTRAVYPRFTACDPESEELGFFTNGTTIANRENGHGAALVSKSFRDWKSIWSASPCLPGCLLTEFAESAGVSIFSKRGDQVFYGPGWFGLHSKISGPLTVKLPGKFHCTDAVSGTVLPGVRDCLELELKRGETVLWNLDSVERNRNE